MSNPLSSIRDSLQSENVSSIQKAKIAISAWLAIAGFITELVGIGQMFTHPHAYYPHAYSQAVFIETVGGGAVAAYSAIALKRTSDQGEAMRGIRKADDIFLSTFLGLMPLLGPGIPVKQEKTQPLHINQQT